MKVQKGGTTNNARRFGSTPYHHGNLKQALVRSASSGKAVEKH